MHLKILKASLLALAVLLLPVAEAANLKPFTTAKAREFNLNGEPGAGFKLYTYVAGSATPKASYSNPGGTSENTNPVVYDAEGRASIYLSGSYKLILKTDADVTVWTVDNYDAELSQVVSGFNDLGKTPTRTGNTTFTVAGDETTKFVQYRRLKLTDATTIYASVSTSSYDSGTDKTTVTVADGTAVLSASLTAVALGIGETGDNLHVEHVFVTSAGGGAVMTGGTHTIPILASAMFSRTTNGAAPGLVELGTNDVMLASKDFDQTTSEGVQFYIPMPKSWNEGTLTFQYGWTAASGTGTATFSTACTAFSDDDALDTAFAGAQSVTDTLLTANDMHITGVTAAVTVQGTPAESDFLICETTRDVADTLNADAKLIWQKAYLTYNASNDN